MHFIKLGEKNDFKRLIDLDNQVRAIADIRNEKRDIYPINLDEEIAKFKAAWKKGERYNPQFKYDSIDYTKTDIEKRIDLAKKGFTEFSHEFSQFYLNLLDFYGNWVSVFCSDKERSTHKFADGLFQLYGKTDFRGLELSKSILKTTKRKEVSESDMMFSGKDLVDRFNKKMIDDLGIDPWKCEFKNIPGRIGLSTPERKIFINEKAKFTEGDVNSLLAHEIGVHVYRAETGYDLGLFGFTIGSLDNESIEEGLAIRRSYNLKVTKPNILFEASINCLVSSIVDTRDFYSIVEFLMNYNEDLDWCFKKTCRVKRSLEDTSVFGGFSRDQVYMKGYAIVKELDDKTYNEDLFKYRLANSELHFIPTLDRFKKIKDSL
jgi:hypothetical protein